MTFSIETPRGVATTPLGKYVWEKPSGEQGLNVTIEHTVIWVKTYAFSIFNKKEDFSRLKLYPERFSL